MGENQDGDIMVLRGGEVRALLANQEEAILEAVRAAYLAHGRGASSLPHSLFLRFPDDERNRIIALPAYLGDGFDVAGVKWVSSFPNNVVSQGLDRASAVVILNSPSTGRPQAILEGSVISATRTAASAALAARELHQKERPRVGLFGTGLINFEVTRFLLHVFPETEGFVVYDLDRSRAETFRRRCAETFGGLDVEVAESAEAVLSGSTLVSMATTAVRPHIDSLAACPAGTTVLHVSLRDLSAEVILSADNVVDDVDHVCRAQTSVHLAEQQVGNRDFMRCTLADVLSGAAPARRDEEGLVIFSPFGLGVLDLAVSKLVCDLAARQQYGTTIESFLPTPWAG